MASERLVSRPAVRRLKRKRGIADHPGPERRSALSLAPLPRAFAAAAEGVDTARRTGRQRRPRENPGPSERNSGRNRDRGHL